MPVARRGDTVVTVPPAFKRKLERLRKDIEADVEVALADAAEDVTQFQKRLAPVGNYQGGGELRDSIGWERGRRKVSRGFGFFTNPPPRVGYDARANLVVTLFAEKFYVRFVEFGTAPGTKGTRVASSTGGRRSRKVLRTHPGVAARPFFYPAWRARRKAVLARIRRAIGKAIRKANAS